MNADPVVLPDDQIQTSDPPAYGGMRYRLRHFTINILIALLKGIAEGRVTLKQLFELVPFTPIVIYIPGKR